MSPNLSDMEEIIRGDKERLQSDSSSESDLSEELLQGKASLSSSSENHPSRDSETIDINLKSGSQQHGLMERDIISSLETTPMESFPRTNELIKEIPYDFDVSTNSKEPVLKGSKEFFKDLDPAFEIRSKEILPSSETPPSGEIQALDQNIKEEINQRTSDSENEEHNNHLDEKITKGEEKITKNDDFERHQEATSIFNNQNLWIRKELNPFIPRYESSIVEEQKYKSDDFPKIYEKYGLVKQKELERFPFYPQNTSSPVVAPKTNLRRTSEQELNEIRIDMPTNNGAVLKIAPKKTRTGRDKAVKSLFAFGAVAFIGGSLCYLLSNDS